jgi:alpha-glucoside transport system permease protein
MTATAGEPAVVPATTGSSAVLGEPAGPARAPGRAPQKSLGQSRWLWLVFLGPALILLAVIVFYPLIYTLVRSLFGDGAAGSTGSFVGLGNYKSVFTNAQSLRAFVDNLVWVAVVPTIITIVGLIFAVLSERIRWATAFKTVLFMPMAISFLASGVTFGLIYADQPSRGLANAVVVGVHDTFGSSVGYPNEHSRDTAALTGSPGRGYTSAQAYAPGSPALLPMTGMDLQHPPASAKAALQPTCSSGLCGVVWNDFKLGGGGTPGKVDPGELGLAGVRVQAVQNGKTVASTTADAHGVFTFPKLASGQYRFALPAANFGAPYNGLSWLGPGLITPSIMMAYLWIYAGFAMVLLAAGMAAIPRDALEAARIDGATEWQVFRRITAPLLAPVLVVVFVTLVINVLKLFDIVFIIGQAAGANARYANVLAVQLYTYFGNQRYGLASAIGILLVLLVLPAMILNVRRFRREQQ